MQDVLVAQLVKLGKMDLEKLQLVPVIVISLVSKEKVVFIWLPPLLQQHRLLPDI